MPGADGSIIIKAEISDKEAQKELASLTKKIDSMNEKVYRKQQEKMPLVDQAKQLGTELDAAKAKLDQMQISSGISTDAINEQKETVKSIQYQWDSVNKQIDRIDTSIKTDTASVEIMEERAGELSAQLAGTGDSTNYMADAVNRAEKYMDKFTNRVKKLASRVFVFTMITAALRSMRTWLGNVIKTNSEATAAIAKLKGALLTLAQPLVNVIIPAFTEFVNVLAKIVSAIASVVSMIFGTTIEQSAEAAENLYNEQQALKGVGTAAKKAGKSLSSFDEINKLSGETAESGGSGTEAESITPDFSGVIGERLGAITALVAGALLAVGALLAFSGVNIPIGLALMAAGAITLATVVAENWDYIVQAVEGPLGIITAILSGASLVLGIILAFSGANIPLGLGLIAVGAIGLAASVTANWETIKTILQEKTDIITAILSGALLVFGAVLAFSGASLPLGLGLMILGAASLASTAYENWDTVQTLLKGPIGIITAILSGALLVLGAILAFSGANLPLGIGLMILGAAGLATTATANWYTISNLMQGPVGIITALISGALLVVGAVLLFSGTGIPLGLGLIFAGAAGLAAAIVPNWNYIPEKLKGIWDNIKNWWNTTVIGGLERAKETVKNWGSGVIDKIKEVFGIHSPSAEMYEMGDYMMQGMANGINDNASPVTSAFQIVLDALQTEFDTWNTNFMYGFTQFEDTFSDRWKTMWNNVNIQFVNSWNNILTTFQDGINNAIDALNELVREANALAGLTGTRYKYASRINVQKLAIPKLAQGAVIPPNKEFLAVLGDQKQGTNIETPLATMVQAFKQALAETGYGGSSEAVLMLDRDVLGKVVYRLNKSESNRIGVNLTEV